MKTAALRAVSCSALCAALFLVVGGGSFSFVAADAAAPAVASSAASSAPPSRVGDGWGTNIHWTHEPVPGEAAQLARAFRTVRMDFSWGSIEKTCGEFDFSDYDALLDTMTEHGLRPYWILDYGNPCYPPPPVPPVNCTTKEQCAKTCQLFFNECDDDGWYYCCDRSPDAPSGCTQQHVCKSDPNLQSCACGNATTLGDAVDTSPDAKLWSHQPLHQRLGINPGCNTPECIAAFGKFAAAAVEHFKGHNIIWECLNEPNGMGDDNATDIAAVCRSAGAAFSAAGELFVGPATSGIDFPYLDQAMGAGILDAFGAVSVHPYRPLPPDTVLSNWQELRAMIEAHGTTPEQQQMPMISGEWGYTTAELPCVYPNRVDELSQASYLARMWLANTLAGVNISINYDWSDGNGARSDCEAHFGSVNWPPVVNRTVNPYDPKLKFTAAVVLQEGLGNFQQYSGRMTPIDIQPSHIPEGNVFILRFDNDTASASEAGFAVWTNGSLLSPAACNPPGVPSPPGWTREDCGHYGISKADCLSNQNPKGPGCCWEPNVTIVPSPQCYKPFPPPATELNVSFVAIGANKSALTASCWKVVDVVGTDLGTTCAEATTGILQVTAPRLENATHNAPVYLLPVFA